MAATVRPTKGGQMATFSAMTWNVENLFRPDTEAEGAERERYQSNLWLLAEVIVRLD